MKKIFCSNEIFTIANNNFDRARFEPVTPWLGAFRDRFQVETSSSRAPDACWTGSSGRGWSAPGTTWASCSCVSGRWEGKPVNKKICLFLFISLLPAFLQLVLQLHFRAGQLPMIGARQPSELDYWSLLTAAYPTQGRSKHDDSWASRSNWK